MSKSERFEFGEINLPKGSLPSPEDVYEAIEAMDDTYRANRKRKNISMRDKPRDRCEEDTDVYLGDDHDEYSYCCFQLLIDLDDGTVVATKNGDGDGYERTQSGVIYSRVFYFENGQFAIGSTRGLLGRRIPEFIGEVTGNDVGDAYEFYETPHTVTRNEEKDPGSINGSHSSNCEDSVGGSRSRLRVPTDLTEATEQSKPINSDSITNQSADIVDETAERLLESPSGRDGPSTDEVFASGTVVTTWTEANWPSDEVMERRAETIREKIVPYLRRHT